MDRQHVIIVGAGISGLTIASEIAHACNVTLLEVRNEPGGRIRTIKQAGSPVVEAGAEFVHGDTPVTNELLKAAGLKPVKLDGKMFRKEGKEWSEEEDMVEGWDELVAKMKGQRNDMTMQDFLEKYFSHDNYAELRRHIRAFVNGFDVADIDEVSVQSLYQEWSNEGDQYRLESGYGSLVDYLVQSCKEAGCELIMGDAVRQVDWQKNEVSVLTSSGKKYDASKIVITVPVSVLRNLNGGASINITPPVDEYINASRNIGFGTVVKVVFELREKLWKNKTGFIFSNEMIPTWWTHYPLNNNLITGWAGGPVAAQLGQRSDDELLEIALTSLSRIFDMESAAQLRNIIVNSYVFNWSKYDESLGAYSFSTPDSKSARKLLNTPLADTVFFSGEALYEGPFSGTVEAALSIGRKTAAGLLKTL